MTDIVPYSDEQVKLIKDTVAKDATNNELQLFLNRAKVTGLDPFSHQIWFVKRNKNQPGIIQTGIDGYRLIADRTGRHAGTDLWWCADDGVWRDVWLAKQPPAAARCIVKKVTTNGVVAEFSAIALWDEYGRKSDGFAWKDRPAGQLGKCAEALALRRAFPAETSGMYTNEEMDQAGPPLRAQARNPEAEGQYRQQMRELGVADSETGEIRSVVRQPPKAARKAEPEVEEQQKLGEEASETVMAAEAKWQILGECVSLGWSDADAKARAAEAWGDRGSAPIDRETLDRLIVDLPAPTE